MNYRELLKQYLDGLGAKEIHTVAGFYLVGFSDWLQINVAQQSFAPDSLKAGDSSLPESVKVENVLPAKSG
jgi:hypothetical protein